MDHVAAADLVQASTGSQVIGPHTPVIPRFSNAAGRALYGIYISARAGAHRTYTPQARHCVLYSLEARMLDAIFLTAGLAFFAVCVGYTLIC